MTRLITCLMKVMSKHVFKLACYFFFLRLMLMFVDGDVVADDDFDVTM